MVEEVIECTARVDHVSEIHLQTIANLHYLADHRHFQTKAKPKCNHLRITDPCDEILPCKLVRTHADSYIEMSQMVSCRA
jgi:hypothetical protein